MTLFVTLLVLSLAAQAPAPTKAEQLQDAASKGDAATVKRLLDEGVDVNTKFRYNTTAIFFACDAGQIDVVKVLLDHGADLTVKDTFYGMTPLALAVQPPRKKTPAHNDRRAAHRLARAGACRQQDEDGGAAREGRREAV